MTHTQLTDKELVQAVAEMQMGLVDANLGAGLFKKRIAIAGKRGTQKLLKNIAEIDRGTACDRDTKRIFNQSSP